MGTPTMTGPVDEAEHGPRDIIFRGSLDEVQEHYLRNGWTDGLPIVPPTRDRVERFVAASGRDPEASMGVLRPERREATVWSCAVNAVMAGCRPEYMPVLLAIVDAICDPRFHIQDAGSTPGWEPLICVSGPVVERLDFNAGTGVMRVGRQANTSIGRFLRLYMRNIAGLRIPPGATDQAAIGYTFNVALAESDSVVREAGLEPVRHSLGFSVSDSIVVVQSARAVSPPIYTSGDTAEEHLQGLRDVIEATLTPSVYRAYVRQRQSPLIVLSPGVTRLLTSAGLDRLAIQRYFARECWIDVHDVEKFAWRTGLTEFSTVAAARSMDIEIRQSGSAQLVPMFIDPAEIMLVVAGNPGRNQSRAYFDNGQQGTRIVRRVLEV